MSASSSKVNILGIGIDPVDMEQALARIAFALRLRRKGYVAFTGVHGVMEAQRDPALARVLANAALTIPDGMPTVWVGRLQGHRTMDRVTGPDLMMEMMAREEFRGYSHFLCGGKEGIALELKEKLLARFPDLSIVGTFTPPFTAMTRQQEDDFVARVNVLSPDIIWVGISTPKQEHFMARYLPRLETTLMFGVGAAFDFHTGRIKDCANWIKRAGLQWLHRLIQNPRHLWKRYLRNNPLFIYRILQQIFALKIYERMPCDNCAGEPLAAHPPISKRA